jgi:hypothetical protein
MVKLSILSGLKEVVNANVDEALLSHVESLSNEESEEQRVLDTDDGAGADDTTERSAM